MSTTHRRVVASERATSDSATAGHSVATTASSAAQTSQWRPLAGTLSPEPEKAAGKGSAPPQPAAVPCAARCSVSQLRVVACACAPVLGLGVKESPVRIWPPRLKLAA